MNDKCPYDTWDIERVDRTINWLKNKFWRE